uniref:Uncharacterized protein n=1 Tax=Prorocentrum micans TaxID=2945 RepID=A0A7S2X505_PROMC|mmetsp:Transcript_4534/g.3537  ORF Transcript_4534/g.3537 Transcript_4534/m.3537 type:complete len:111 (+) Transcript_4534:192-524(+)
MGENWEHQDGLGRDFAAGATGDFGGDALGDFGGGDFGGGDYNGRYPPEGEEYYGEKKKKKKKKKLSCRYVGSGRSHFGSSSRLKLASIRVCSSTHPAPHAVLLLPAIAKL